MSRGTPNWTGRARRYLDNEDIAQRIYVKAARAVWCVRARAKRWVHNVGYHFYMYRLAGIYPRNIYSTLQFDDSDIGSNLNTVYLLYQRQ